MEQMTRARRGTMVRHAIPDSRKEVVPTESIEDWERKRSANAY